MSNILRHAKNKVISTMMIPPAIRYTPMFDFLTPINLYLQTPPPKDKEIKKLDKNMDIDK